MRVKAAPSGTTNPLDVCSGSSVSLTGTPCSNPAQPLVREFRKEKRSRSAPPPTKWEALELPPKTSPQVEQAERSQIERVLRTAGERKVRNSEPSEPPDSVWNFAKHKFREERCSERREESEAQSAHAEAGGGSTGIHSRWRGVCIRLHQTPKKNCGGGGIRTRGTVARTHDFQSCTFGRSVTPPGVGFLSGKGGEPRSGLLVELSRERNKNLGGESGIRTHGGFHHT